MNQRLNELHLQRGRLLERIATQRAVLARNVEPVHAALDTTDRLLAHVQAGIYYLKTHPTVIVVALAALVIFKPKRTWRWSRRAFTAWQTWQLLREKITTIGL